MISVTVCVQTDASIDTSVINMLLTHYSCASNITHYYNPAISMHAYTNDIEFIDFENK